MSNNVFGFSTEPSQGGDFTPIIKYNALAGRIFRIDRLDTGNGFENSPVDITAIFKAIVDFDNVEVGWMDFPVGSAPSFALVTIGNELPARPSLKHKNGIRFLLKLAKNCGGDRPIREIAGNAKAFLNGVKEVYSDYLKEKDKHKDELPVISLVTVTPVVGGNGKTKSTSYQPTFKIDGWVKRPDDLIHIPAPSTSQATSNGSGVAPVTGAQTVPPPNKMAPPQNLSDDFG